MLSEHEQRVWNDIERFWAEDAAEPPRSVPVAGPVPRDLADLPALVVAGVWGAILLMLFGALVAGLSVGAATAFGWALWHFWPRLGRTDPTTTSVWDEVDRGRQGARPPAEEPWQQRRGSEDR